MVGIKKVNSCDCKGGDILLADFPELQTPSRAWAMRTSRFDESHRAFVASELLAGRLRQGWGHTESQNLRVVHAAIKANGYASLSDQQREAWGHWRLLGEEADNTGNAMEQGDVILVPNVPENGLFTLCRVIGPYYYQIDPALNDLGHVLEVQVLTPGGVSFTQRRVSADLRRSLRCRFRLWWLSDHIDCLGRILEAANEKEELRAGAEDVVRAHHSVTRVLDEGLDSILPKVEPALRHALQGAEWERVLQTALQPLLRNIEVIHTGGPREAGADLEIHIPNPFAPRQPWVVAVQVKDYDNEVTDTVANQLEEAIVKRHNPETRPGETLPGGLVAVVLAVTRARPTEQLIQRMNALSVRYKIPVSCVQGNDLLRAITRGFLARGDSAAY